MARNIILASADGSASASAGLTSADVTSLIQATSEWELIKEISLNGIITSIDFSGADYNTNTYKGFKAYFPTFRVSSSFSPSVAWKNPPSTSGTFWVRLPDGSGTYSGNNTNTMYLSSQSYQASSHFAGELTWFLGNKPSGFWNSWGDATGYWGTFSECSFLYLGASGSTINGLVLNGISLDASTPASNDLIVYVYGMRKRT